MTRKLYLLLPICSFAFFQLAAQCSFTVSEPTACGSTSINFTVDNPVTGSSYNWDFENDGDTDLDGSDVDFAFPILFMDSTYNVVLFEDGDSCTTQSVTVLAVPDASIGVPPGSTILDGNEIKACNGDEQLVIELYNASLTFDENVSYDINWGDNSPIETYDNTTFSQLNTISHNYGDFGYYTIFITVTHTNGCVYTNSYSLYNGGNPSVGLVIPGNTVGLCAPATLEFPITNTDNNPPGTEYTISVNGEIVATYSQDSLPDSFIYTFLEGSCGETTSTGNYENAFDVKIVASNPCNSSTATIEPIEVSEPPSVDFVITPDGNCAGSEVTFSDATININEVVSGNPSDCVDVLLPSWEILGGVPGQDWEIISGNIFNSPELILQFFTPGVYTIEMTIVSFACGPITISQTLSILEPPVIDANLSIDTIGNSGCAPLAVPLTNNSSGEEISYSWTVDPPTGWYFDNGADSTAAAPQIIFEEGGTYTIELAASNPCETLLWDTTIVVNGPPLINATPLEDSCQFAQLDFTSSTVFYGSNGLPITNYYWEFPGANPASSTEPFPTGIIFDQPGLYPVSLLVSNECGDRIWMDTFEVQMPESLTLPPPISLCGNDTPQQLSADPANGAWSGPGISPSGLFDPALVVPGDQILQYSYGVGACLVEGTTSISVLDPPVVVLPDPFTLCTSEAALPINPQPTGGTWTDPDGILQGDLLDPSNLPAGNFEAIYSYSDSMNCFDADTLSVLINTSPQVVAADSSYCDTPGAVNLPLAVPPGGTWTGPGVVHPAGLFDPEQAGGPGTYNLVYSLTDSLGCTGSDEVVTTVIAPDNVDAGPNQALCLEDTPIDLSMDAFPPGGVWESSSDGLQGSMFDPGLAGPGSFRIYYEVGTGNCAVLDSVMIQIADLTLTSAGPNQNVCIDGGMLQLLGNDPAGGTWSGDGVTDPVNGVFDPVAVGIGLHEIDYQYTDPLSGCSIMVSKIISVKPKPEPDFEIPDLGCVGEPIQFINQTTDAFYFEWAFGDGGQSGADNPTYIYPDTGTYIVSMLAINSFGCERDTTLPITITIPPTAAFIPDHTEDCAGAEVQFENVSTGLFTEYLWDFGNGQYSSEEDPVGVVVYEQGINDTLYVVSLDVTNLCGSASWYDTILVHPLPIANFGFTVDTGCSPLELAINNITLGSPESFYWDLGNGVISTDSIPPIQTYFTDTLVTTYTITLVAENSCGSDTLSQEVVVQPEEVTAFFNVSNTEGCAPFTVDFTDYTGMGTTVSWDFGDGNISDLPNPQYTFNSSGIFTVIQYASNACGADSTTMDIEVYPEPDLSFSWQDPLCDNQPVQFLNTSTPLAGITWDFGSGIISNETDPLYQFPGEGSYEITLTGTAQLTGCESTTTNTIIINEAPVAGVDFGVLNGCAPLSVDFTDQSTGADFYQWNFGDGNTSILSQPSHIYLEDGTYTATLTVSNAAGCSDTTHIEDITVYPIPAAVFTISQDTFCGLPATVQFANQSEGAEGFTWDFGTGIQSNLNDPEFEYTEPGTYSVSLSVFTQYGCTDEAVMPVTIFPLPLADFAFEDIPYCSPQEVTFENYSVGDTFEWNFGDGGSSISDNPIYTYMDEGSYDVQLIASFGTACSDTLIVPNPLEILRSPVAFFSYLDGQNGILEFLNESSFADQYFWDFGDGTLSEETHPTHRFSSNGVRQIFLEALAENGCRDTFAIHIQPELFGSLYVPNALTPEQGDPEVKHFLPKGVGLIEYQLQIFSTYGELMWESTELKDGQPAIGWDGTYRGEVMPQDVYVWKVFALFEDGTEWKGQLQPNGTFKRIGSVTLIR